MNRWVNKNDAFSFERDQAEITTLRGLTFEMLGKTGDARKGMVVAEKSLRFRRAKHAGRYSVLT